MKELILYIQPNCGLCEDAKIQINLAKEDVKFNIEEVNIEENEVLNTLYCLRVPVLIDRSNQKIVQEGQVDFVTIIEYFTDDINNV
ncbi:glutaredoxin family protein [Macrococcus sp. EM39E]|uniref:glutaredoxin family protein n=1 Tax=Macrococcus animalis TaxID=3395467 RepID=UPI0039BEC074